MLVLNCLNYFLFHLFESIFVEYFEIIFVKVLILFEIDLYYMFRKAFLNMI